MCRAHMGESPRDMPIGKVKVKSALMPDLVLLQSIERPNDIFLQQWSAETGDMVGVSFSEYAKRVAAGRRSLEKFGVQPGDRVAFLCNSSIEYFTLVLSTMSAGATPVNLNYRQPVENLEQMCQSVLVDHLVSSSFFQIEAKSLHASKAFKGSLMFLEPVEGESLVRCEPEPLARNEPFFHAELHPDDFAVIMFTSGSTAVPKAVPLTHKGLSWLFQSKFDAEGYVPGEKHGGAMCFMPCYHVMGFCNNFLFCLYAGVRAFLLANSDTTPINPTILIEAVETCRPSVLTTVPWIMEAFAAMAQNEDRVAKVLSSVKYILVGGAKLSKFCVSTLSARGVGVRSICGATEVGGSILIGETGEPTLRMRPYPGVSWELLPCPGYESDDGSNQGVLVLSGAHSVTPGYIRKEGKVNVDELHAKSGYNTNDVFNEVSDGWICHVCRADDLIVHSSGEKTNPVPLEVLLKKETGSVVARLCLIGTDRPRPVLIAELSETALKGPHTPQEAASAILHAVAVTNETAPPYSRIDWRQVLVVVPGKNPTLPVSGKGNVVRSAIEKRFKPELDHVFETSQAAAQANDGAAQELLVMAKEFYAKASAFASQAFQRVAPARKVDSPPLKQPLMANGQAVSPTDVEAAREAVCEHDWLATQLGDHSKPSEEAGGFDSLDFASMMNSRRSPTDAMRGHMYWFLMYCVVVRHVVHKYQQHATVLAHAQLTPTSLQGIHNAFGTFAIPGFIALVGWRDSTIPPRTLSHIRRQIFLPLAICVMMQFVAPPLIRVIYGAAGYDDKSVHNQGLLPYFASWLLLMITICRAILVLTTFLRIPRVAVAAVAVASHFSCAAFECPWPLTRYGRHFNTEGFVRPVLSAYWIYYTLLPLLLPRTFLAEVPAAHRLRRWLSPLVSAAFVLGVGYWALDHFNTEFSSAADRRRYGCDPNSWSHQQCGMSLGAWLVSDKCASLNWADAWEDVWHNALAFAMIAALGHLMPKRQSALSAIGEASLVCLVVHMCLWAFLWPMVWEVVGAAGRISHTLLPLIALLGSAFAIQVATSFHVTVSEPLLEIGQFKLRLPVVAPPSPSLFHAAWYTILALKLGVCSGTISANPNPVSSGISTQVLAMTDVLLANIWSENVA